MGKGKAVGENMKSIAKELIEKEKDVYVSYSKVDETKIRLLQHLSTCEAILKEINFFMVKVGDNFDIDMDSIKWWLESEIKMIKDSQLI